MKRTLAVVFVTTLAYAPLHAQGGTIQFPTPTYSVITTRVGGGIITKDPASTLTDMKVALHDLVVAEEKYFSEHGTYTTDGLALGVWPVKSRQQQGPSMDATGDPQPSKVSVQVIFAGSRGWTGMATDPSMKGKSCVVYIGSEKELPGGVPKTMAAGISAQTEAVPVCDEP